MQWYEYTEGERIKNVFSKYTIKDFWNWWSKNNYQYMEIRIKDFKLIRETAYKYKLPHSKSGVYVKNSNELKNVISFVREKATIWFGINPRKKNWQSKTRKGFGGGDIFIDSLCYIFIDIDRVKKDGPASKIDLENCDKLSELILEKLGEQGWNKNYCKICSGNGVQLLVGLDIPIKIPDIIFNTETGLYEHNTNFERIKLSLKEGIGKQMINFSKKFKDTLNVEVDKSGFLIGKVGALPVTKNYKYEGFTWRGIISMQNGENVGLTDYIFASLDKIKDYKVKNIFTGRKLTTETYLSPQKLLNHKFIKFLLECDLPEGSRNNALWFSFKLLLRDNKIDINSKEVKYIHKLLEKKWNDMLAFNMPDKKYKFNEMTINNFCIQNGIKPVFDLWPQKTKKLNMKLENLTWDFVSGYDEKMPLENNTIIFEDMENCKKILVEGANTNIDKIAAFTNGCINKYGEKKTKFYFDILFYKFFSFK